VLPEALRKEFGMDAEKYQAYYESNLEYLMPESGGSLKFVVDEDVKRIGCSNRQVEMLDRCVSMLEQNQQPELALRLLQRYTQENYGTGAEWRAWLDKNRKRLFFSDLGGYKFFVSPT
jgi:hypothetical protein